MPRRPAPRSSQLQLLAREARPSCGYNPSPMGGITHVYCGGAGTTLRGSLCSPLRMQPRGALGLLRAIPPAGGVVAMDSAVRRG